MNSLARARLRSLSVIIFLERRDLLALLMALSAKISAAPEGMPRPWASILMDFLMDLICVGDIMKRS